MAEDITKVLGLQKDLVTVHANVDVVSIEGGEPTQTSVDNLAVRGKLEYQEHQGDTRKTRRAEEDLSQLRRHDVLAHPPVAVRCIPLLTWQKGVSYILPTDSNSGKPYLCFIARRGEYHSDRDLHYSRVVLDWFAKHYIGNNRDQIVSDFFTPGQDGEVPSGWASNQDGRLKVHVRIDLSDLSESLATDYRPVGAVAVATRLLDGTIKFWWYTGTQTASPLFENWGSRVVCTAKMTEDNIIYDYLQYALGTEKDTALLPTLRSFSVPRAY